MNSKKKLAVGGLLLAGISAASIYGYSQPDNIQIELCDGETIIEVSGGEKTAEEGRVISASLMNEWLTRNPGRNWDMSAAQDPQKSSRVPDEIIEKRHTILPPFDNRYLLGDGQSEGHSYGNWTQRDLMIWERETKKFVVEGARVFHDAGLLGSTISVSCDMCHPDASNTHPETYPKYQTQLGKVVLLRDMINWCVQHPVRGEALPVDGPKMRALEAYIYGQRKGKELQYGKH